MHMPIPACIPSPRSVLPQLAVGNVHQVIGNGDADVHALDSSRHWSLFRPPYARAVASQAVLIPYAPGRVFLEGHPSKAAQFPLDVPSNKNQSSKPVPRAASPENPQRPLPESRSYFERASHPSRILSILKCLAQIKLNARAVRPSHILEATS